MRSLLFVFAASTAFAAPAHKVSEEYELDGAAVQAAVKKESAPKTTALPNGLRLEAAKGIWLELGFRAGDVIESVDLGDAPKTLSGLPFDRSTNLKIVRGGGELILKWHVAGASPPSGELAKYIFKVTEVEYAVKRSYFDQLIKNPEEATKQARFLPWMRGGKPRGFIIYAARPDGLYAALGLQNGDILTSVNDIPLADGPTAGVIYQQLHALPEKLKMSDKLVVGGVHHDGEAFQRYLRIEP